MRPLAAAAALALAACGASSSPADGPGLDAGAGCSVPPGQSYVLSAISLSPEADGVDVDGDGDVDDALGKMPPQYLDTANQGLQGLLDDGTLMILLHVTDWTDPPTPTDPEIGLSMFGAYDADDPRDPSNNFDGDGRFLVASDHLDVNCRSTAVADEASLEGGVLTARRATGWRMLITNGSGTVAFERATFVITFAAAFDRGDAVLGAVMPMCSLSAVPFPGQANGTILDVLVNDPNLTATVHPDMDLDGDGLEQVLGDGVGIRECRDGDGTVIAGADCPCHPSIQDGYSLTLRQQIVTATIVGVY